MFDTFNVQHSNSDLFAKVKNSAIKSLTTTWTCWLVVVSVIKKLPSHCAVCMERREWVCIDSLFTYDLHIYKMTAGQQIGRTAVVSVSEFGVVLLFPRSPISFPYLICTYSNWNWYKWNQHGTFLHILFGLVSLMQARFKSNTHTQRDRVSRHSN